LNRDQAQLKNFSLPSRTPILSSMNCAQSLCPIFVRTLSNSWPGCCGSFNNIFLMTNVLFLFHEYSFLEIYMKLFVFNS
ncbi:hypothetical protein T12_12386, partial [Trichinella patagoniensis]